MNQGINGSMMFCFLTLQIEQEMPHASSPCHLRQDLLGFNVTYTVMPGQVECYFSVAGCATPGNAADRGCGPDGPSVAC